MKLLLLVLAIQTISAARTKQRGERDAQQRIQSFADPMGRVATGGPHSLQNGRAHVNTVPVVSNTASSIRTGDIENINEAIQNTILIFVLSSLYYKTLAVELGKRVSTVNNQPLYYGTAVDQGPAVPTVIFNCDRLRAICWNLQEFMNDQTNTGYGALPLIFHYDRDMERKVTRRDFSCPQNWQRKHLGNRCGNVPGQPNVEPGNLPPVVVPPVPVEGPQPWTPRGPNFNNEIPNLANTASSGMAFTCEEMPAASWIEGGDGGPPYVHVNCAPQSVSCSSSLWAQIGEGYPNTTSEQNWQSTLYGYIAAYARLKSGGAGTVMRFALSAENLGPAAATAGRIILPSFGTSSRTTRIAHTKRTDEPKFEAPKSHIECEGIFCHELSADPAFNFDDIRTPPPPPTLAAVIGRSDPVESDGPEETGESATLYVMV
ncbi:hypothetical protein GQX73_g7641 [Xylaria multiplex]|uniref:Uncharacterized protein n=1 Tax=Xylaria multiplex TaxID=323545 RepID=A0A7C8N1E0_9PEZI|nr:hypothetical protein GQX73_g7641 [Xylaria multiplex]